VKYHVQHQPNRQLSRLRLCWRLPTGYYNTGFPLKEMSHATAQLFLSPPPPWGEPPHLSSRPAWHSLTPEQREMILRALARLLARHLLPTRDNDKEVADERN
jgi:hypothetical protein